MAVNQVNTTGTSGIGSKNGPEETAKSLTKEKARKFQEEEKPGKDLASCGIMGGGCHFGSTITS